MAEGRLRFIDLEYAAFRHPFLDGCYPLIGHLICTDGLHLPDELRQQMVATYRTGIAGAYPELVEMTRFAADMAAAAAMRMVWHLTKLPQSLHRDRVVGHYLIRARQRMVAVLEAFTLPPGRCGSCRLPASKGCRREPSPFSGGGRLRLQLLKLLGQGGVEGLGGGQLLA
jgi:hypothetical protein